MIQLINNDATLYRGDRESYLRSLEYAKGYNSDVKDRDLTFHCLWRGPKEFSRKQIAVLKSVIVNHTANTKINLWSDMDLSNNPLFKQVSNFVTLRHWSIENEIKDTILENKFSTNDVRDSLCYIEGDIFRLLVLYKYGGFYIDMDVLVLRDLSPLSNLEFLYQWGNSGNNGAEPNITANGAIMKLNQYSNLAFEFIEKIKETHLEKDSTICGTQLYSRIVNNDLLLLPGVWLNSEWGREELFPFRNTGSVDLYDGAFTWHWHNKWDEEVQDGSKFQVIESLQDIKFKLISK